MALVDQLLYTLPPYMASKQGGSVTSGPVAVFFQGHSYPKHDLSQLAMCCRLVLEPLFFWSLYSGYEGINLISEQFV